MKSGRNWVWLCVGFFAGPLIYVLTQHLWTATLSWFYDPSSSRGVAAASLAAHSATGAAIAGALVGVPLGFLARRDAVVVVSVACASAASILGYSGYVADDFWTRVTVACEVAVLATSSLALAQIAARLRTARNEQRA